jgi:hypothetical protein
VLARASIMIPAALLLIGLSLAQQPPGHAAQPAFRAQTDLVVVPFETRSASPYSPYIPYVLFTLQMPKSFKLEAEGGSG